MGLYVKGVLGSFSGKVGTVVGANWRSIDYMRSLPRPSKKPATDKQRAHRAKFALVVNFLSPLRELINISYNDGGRTKQTAFNRATSDLMSIVQGEMPDFTIPYGKVVLANGGLSLVHPTLESGVDGAEVRWNSKLGTVTSDPKDVVNIVLYDEEKDDFYVFQDALREDESYEIPFNELDSESLHTWVFTTSADGNKCSKSVYLGVLGA